MLATDQRLKKFNHALLTEIIAELEIPDDIKQQIQILPTDIEIIEALKTSNQWLNAIKFLAYGLPPRETIWWAYICVIDSLTDTPDPAIKYLLQTVEAWVKNPTESNRRLAAKFADEFGLYAAVGWLATAVFWSGGSITPDDKPSVEPAKFMCHTAAVNAISLAANSSSDKAAYYEKTLRRGLHIALGGNGSIE